ncbi:Ig-like protein group 3, partial [Frischella perrara]|uniref:Ig-like domain-containing protein n=1 Tax=Frischella perrara TaxID=1267021 RepID=UPI000D946891
MKSIILDRKTGVSQETSANNFDIGSSKIVILNITKNNILSITQNDNQLVVQLKSGNPIIINDFYSSQDDKNENKLVIDDPSEEELGYWWIEEPNSGLNWVQLDDLNPLMITNTSDGISPWVYAAGAGILAAGVLAGGGGGGGGGHHHKGQQIATPVVSSNNAEGITGTGTPGWEIVLTKPDNTTEVTTVDENGKWSFNQNGNPLAHGETGKIIARDPQNNDKVSKEVETVADCQPPEPPVVEMNNSNGISGTAEPNSTITITNSDGEVVGEAITDANGNWHIEPNPLADGEEGHFTATDKAGNISDVTDDIADVLAPNAPEVKQNNAQGISGKAEANSQVIVTNSKGEVVGDAMADDQGNWHIDYPNPLTDGETGHFTATDAAGNTSKVTDNIADTVVPEPPIVEQNNAQGISGKAEANSKVIVTNSKGEVVGEAIADENNNWHIDSPNPLADGETGHFTATDAAGNTSKVTDNIADTVAPEAPTVEQNNAQGISGKAEANSKVIVTNSKGEVVGEAIADENNNWHIDYPNPLVDGETGHFTATDAAGNTSKVTDNIADTVVPKAPAV